MRTDMYVHVLPMNLIDIPPRPMAALIGLVVLTQAPTPTNDLL